MHAKNSKKHAAPFPFGWRPLNTGIKEGETITQAIELIVPAPAAAARPAAAPASTPDSGFHRLWDAIMGRGSPPDGTDSMPEWGSPPGEPEDTVQDALESGMMPWLPMTGMATEPGMTREGTLQEGTLSTQDCGPQGSAQGIAGILEGFGLLKEADGQGLPSPEQEDVLSSTVLEGAAGEGARPDAVAGMQQEDQQAPPDSVRSAVERLAKAYQCSLENTDNGITQGKDAGDASPASMTEMLAGLYTAPPNATGTQMEGGVGEQAAPVAPQPTRADMVDNLARIVEGIRSRSEGDTREIVVSLKPAHLGRLSIRLVSGEDGLTAQIRVADAAARSLIAGEAPALTQLLRDQGVTLAHLDVIGDTAAFDTRGWSSGQSQGSGDGRRGRLRPGPALEGLTEADATAQRYELLAARHSTIEFTA